MVEGVERSWAQKTRNLLKKLDAKNAEIAKIAPNWNVSGTRRFCSSELRKVHYRRAAAGAKRPVMLVPRFYLQKRKANRN